MTQQLMGTIKINFTGQADDTETLMGTKFDTVILKNSLTGDEVELEISDNRIEELYWMDAYDEDNDHYFIKKGGIMNTSGDSPVDSTGSKVTAER